jgi:hypothetical protein
MTTTTLSNVVSITYQNDIILTLQETILWSPIKCIEHYKGIRQASVVITYSPLTELIEQLKVYSNRLYPILFMSDLDISQLTVDSDLLDHREENPLENLQSQIRSPHYTVKPLKNDAQILYQDLTIYSLWVVSITNDSLLMSIQDKLSNSHKIQQTLSIPTGVMVNLEPPIFHSHWILRKWIKESQSVFQGRSFVFRSNRTWVAICTSQIDKIMSSMCFCPSYDGYEIWSVATLPEYRKQGFSSSILHYIINKYPQEIFYLEVLLNPTDTLFNLVRFYSSFGFFIYHITDKVVQMKRIPLHLSFATTSSISQHIDRQQLEIAQYLLNNKQ